MSNKQIWWVSLTEPRHVLAQDGAFIARTKPEHAQLISAAPEMRDALKAVQDWLAGCSTRATMRGIVDEAVAKAEGQ